MNNFLPGTVKKLFLAIGIFILAGTYNVKAIGGEDCASATLVTVAASAANCSYVTVNSGTSQNGPNAICSDATGNIANDDVWVKFVAPSGGSKLVITTHAGTVNDWVMEVWSGCLGSGSVIKCSDDVSGGMPEISLCQNEYVAGQTYYVRAWTYSQSAAGTMDLCIYQATACIIPPSNDECINATRITINPPLSCPGSAQTFTTVNATSVTSTSATCDATATKNDVWFVFNTGSKGDINLNITPGTAVGLKAQVQFECGGAQIACYNPANGTYSLNGLNPQADYIVRVWAVTAGTFNICLSDICSNPTATISGTQAICPSQSANLSVSFTGVAPYTFVYSNGTTGTSVTTSNNPYTLTVTPTVATTYTITSMSDATCAGTGVGSSTVSFTNPQTVTLPAFTPVCSNAGLQTLTGGSPGGGVYSGTAVSSGKFNPASGSQTITYTVTYAAGCTRNASQVFTVNPLPTATISGSSSICAGQSTSVNIAFTGMPPYVFTYSNGVTTTQLTTSTNPYILTVAPTTNTNYTMVSVVDNNCGGTVSGSALITVTNPGTATLAAFNPVCSNAGLITLSGGSPAGGTYSGTGVSNGKFDPSAGTQTIIYTVGSGNCTNSASKVLTVNTAPTAIISGNTTICAGQSGSFTVSFTGTGPFNFTYSNGTTPVTVNGTSNNPHTVTVSPASTSTYTLQSAANASCPANISGTASISVITPTNPTLNSFIAVCENAGLQTLSGGSPAGGVYSGTGVSNGKFDPSFGTQTITYTITFASGCTRSASQVYTVKSLPAVTLGSFVSVCNTASAFALSGGSPAGGTYSGTGVSSNTFTPSVAGVGTFQIAYTITSNGCSNADSSTITVTACTTCSNPATANAGGDKLSCNGAAVALSGSIGGGATSATWSGGAGTFTPNNSTLTASYTPTTAERTSGLVKLILTTNDPDGAGVCTLARDTMSITFANSPSTPSVTGSATACKNTSNIAYSITAVNGATYAWTVPTGVTIASGNGTNSILVNFTATAVSGNICVTVTNSCGNAQACKAVTLTALPVAQAITGLSNICRTQSSVYKTAKIATATSYLWTPPIGATINGSSAAFSTTDTAVTVLFGSSFAGDTLRVKAVNCSGSSAEKKLRINQRTTTLATPAAITGLTTIPCGTTTSTYKIVSIAGASGYTWRINLAGALINGLASPVTTTDTSVVITFPAFSTATLFVKVNNGCGSSTERSLVIAGVAVPSAPGAVTGLTSICRNQSTVYKIAKVAGATSYSWTPPLGATINGSTAVFSTVDTAVTVLYGNTFAGDSLRIRAVNCGGFSAYKKIKITQRTTVPSTPSGLTGPTVVCGTSAVVYKISTAAGAATYTWRSSIAGTTFNGQAFPYTTTDTTVTVSIPSFTTANLFVKANNGCGSSAEKSLAIKSTPATPASITGPVSVCKSQTNVVYSTAVLAGATSYTWTMPAAGVTLVSGQGTTSITVNFSAAAATRAIKVAGTNACGSGTAKSISVTIAACPRMGDSQQEISGYNVDAYPNPAHDLLNIEFVSGNDAKLSLQMMDLSGRVLRQMDINAIEGKNVYQLDLNGYAEGMYLLNLTGPSGSSQLRIVVE